MPPIPPATDPTRAPRRGRPSPRPRWFQKRRRSDQDGPCVGSLTVYFTAPSSPETITGYTATCSSSSQTGGGSATSLAVTGLTNGLLYNCTLYATDAAGNGPTASFSGYPVNAS